MASIVSTCNLALSHLGKETISALNEATAEARACNRFWRHVLDTVLSAYPWRAATKKVALAAVENDRVGDWAHAYALPPDCLRAISIHQDFTETPAVDPAVLAEMFPAGLAYDIAGSTVYCNTETAWLIYVTSDVDVARLPPMLIEALSWHLATRLAMPLTRDPKVRQTCFEMARATQAQASADDANQTRNAGPEGSAYERAR